ncbi:MAG: protein kinase domain-containing protein [Promethearchaeota archaeon]|jgi:hypothetical protein
MCAEIIKYGDSPPTIGGNYEKDVAQKLCKDLSHRYLIVTNASFPTQSSFFYEYDIILLSPFYCEVIEIKYLYEHVAVYEDWLISVNDFQVPSVFSSLETKAKVFSSKLIKQFKWDDAPFINSRIIVGPADTKIWFKYKKHEKNRKLLKLDQAISLYKDIEKRSGDDKKKIQKFRVLKTKIRSHSENLQTNQRKSHRLGRFYIKRVISHESNFSEYWACDEPPCSVDVYLKEYPFDQFGKNEDVDLYLKRVTHGMQVLRGLRHQYISCVIGHFQTGSSLVQINDWFDGQTLNECWRDIMHLELNEKVSLMIKISKGIGFCHEKGVFHRNICAENILINDELDDLRITGFDYSRDIKHTHTISSSVMSERNNKIIPPEELLTVGTEVQNLRLYDIYQTGLLFYRILENGSWPYNDPLDYCTDCSILRKHSCHSREYGVNEISILITNMLSVEPNNRPNLMQKIEDELNKILEIICQ